MTVRFGGLVALDGISLELRRREVVGLIGPNGAGKTTLTNVVTGFVRPTSGTVRLGARDITAGRPYAVARLGIARTFQAVRLFQGMTVAENIEAAALSSGISRRSAYTRALELLDWIGLSKRASAQAGSLPYTDERRVGIARALALRPRFILLDEPAAGMSDAEGDDLIGHIGEIPRHFGCGVMLIDHNMRVIMGVCTRIHVLQFGRTIAEGAPAEIRANPDVLAAYLGHGGEV